MHVDQQSKRYERTIQTAMQPLVGHPLDGNEVSARIAEIYGLGNFETCLLYTSRQFVVDQRVVCPVRRRAAGLLCLGRKR